MPQPASDATHLLSGLSAVSLVPPRDSSAIAQLTRQLCAGDETAFREFHAHYFDRLYHFLLVVTRGQTHAAQDAAQETMVRVAGHAREFADEEVFWCWLKAIARNAARDGGRKRRSYLALLDRFAFGQTESAPSAAADGRLHAVLEESLAQIAGDDRALLEDKYLRGHTLIELATTNGVSEKALESRLFRLRRQVAEMMLNRLRES